MQDAWSGEAAVLWDAAGLAAILRITREAVVVLDGWGRVRFANPAGQALLGYEPGSLLGTDAFELVHVEDRPIAAAAFAEANDPSCSRPVEASFRLATASGAMRHVEVRAHNLLAAPEVNGIALTMSDVTGRVDAERAVVASEDRFRHLADSAPDLIFRYRLGCDPGFTYANAAASVIGCTPDDLYEWPHLLDELVGSAFAARLRAGRQACGAADPVERAISCSDGTTRWIEVRVVVHCKEDGEPSFVDGIARDLTDRKVAEAELIRRALHDPLTGLPNRALFYDRLEAALRRSDRQPSSPAVLFLDLDGFKAVNDELGHAAGDELLQVVASRLTASVRQGDTVARLGGDEFLILCEDLISDGEVESVCHRLRVAVCKPVDLGDRTTAIDVSIGASLAEHGADADTVVRDADAAMFEHKRRTPDTAASPARRRLGRSHGRRKTD